MHAPKPRDRLRDHTPPVVQLRHVHLHRDDLGIRVLCCDGLRASLVDVADYDFRAFFGEADCYCGAEAGAAA